MLTGFDHVTIAVDTLDEAAARYERLLGAAPVWRGEHPELGTVAALFGLSNSLIELVAPRGNASEAEGLRALLESRGEGLLALAFGTEDAARSSAEFRERGLRASPPESGQARSLDGQLREYRAVELSPRATRGLSVLAIERADFAALRGAPARSGAAPNALDHVVVRTADPDAALGLYERGLGLRLALDRAFGQTRMLFFRIGGVTLEVVQDPALGTTDALFGVCYRVYDIAAAHARLAADGFALSDVRPGNKPNTHVFTVRDGTAGVPTLFIRDASRDASDRAREQT